MLQVCLFFPFWCFNHSILKKIFIIPTIKIQQRFCTFLLYIASASRELNLQKNITFFQKKFLFSPLSPSAYSYIIFSFLSIIIIMTIEYRMIIWAHFYYSSWREDCWNPICTRIPTRHEGKHWKDPAVYGSQKDQNASNHIKRSAGRQP